MRFGGLAAAAAMIFATPASAAVLAEGFTAPSGPNFTEIFSSLPTVQAFRVTLDPKATFFILDAFSGYNGNKYQYNGPDFPPFIDNNVFGDILCSLGSGLGNTCQIRSGFQNFSVLVTGRLDGNIARFSYRSRLTGPFRPEREDVVDVRQSPWALLASVNGGEPVSYQITDIASGAVPEPTTWAMLIGGVGAIGHRLRRRTTRSKARLA